MIILNSEYESRIPRSWKQWFSFICKQGNQFELPDDGVGLSWMMVFPGAQTAAVSGSRAGDTCPHPFTGTALKAVVCTDLCLFAQGRGALSQRVLPPLWTLHPLPPAHGAPHETEIPPWEKGLFPSSQQTPALLAFSVAVGERSPALGANKRVRKWCSVWEGGCVELALGNKETTLL